MSIKGAELPVLLQAAKLAGNRYSSETPVTNIAIYTDSHDAYSQGRHASMSVSDCVRKLYDIACRLTSVTTWNSVPPVCPTSRGTNARCVPHCPDSPHQSPPSSTMGLTSLPRTSPTLDRTSQKEPRLRRRRAKLFFGTCGQHLGIVADTSEQFY